MRSILVAVILVSLVASAGCNSDLLPGDRDRDAADQDEPNREHEERPRRRKKTSGKTRKTISCPEAGGPASEAGVAADDGSDLARYIRGLAASEFCPILYSVARDSLFVLDVSDANRLTVIRRLQLGFHARKVKTRDGNIFVAGETEAGRKVLVFLDGRSAADPKIVSKVTLPPHFVDFETTDDRLVVRAMD